MCAFRVVSPRTSVTQSAPSVWQASSSPLSPPRESYRTGQSSCQNSVCCWTRRTTTHARWGRPGGTTQSFLRCLCLFSIQVMFDTLRWTCIISLMCERKPPTWNRGSAEPDSMWQHTVYQGRHKVLSGYKIKLFHFFSPKVFFCLFFLD